LLHWPRAFHATRQGQHRRERLEREESEVAVGHVAILGSVQKPLFDVHPGVAVEHHCEHSADHESTSSDGH